jgi:hypothetical protein
MGYSDLPVMEMGYWCPKCDQGFRSNELKNALLHSRIPVQELPSGLVVVELEKRGQATNSFRVYKDGKIGKKHISTHFVDIYDFSGNYLSQQMGNAVDLVQEIGTGETRFVDPEDNLEGVREQILAKSNLRELVTDPLNIPLMIKELGFAG